jgi:hypothetical protein
MSKRSWRRERNTQSAQGCLRRGIGDAVRALGPEMALESSHDALRLFAIETRGFDCIPIPSQGSLQLRHLRPLIPKRKGWPVTYGRRRHEIADSRAMKLLPRKALARILLARRRDIGVRKDTRRVYRPA